MLRNGMGVCGCLGGVQLRLFQHYNDVRSNVISVSRGWGFQTSRKKRYVRLEWPPNLDGTFVKLKLQNSNQANT